MDTKHYSTRDAFRSGIKDHENAGFVITDNAENLDSETNEISVTAKRGQYSRKLVLEEPLRNESSESSDRNTDY